MRGRQATTEPAVPTTILLCVLIFASPAFAQFEGQFETGEPWYDQLAGELLPEDACPSPVGNHWDNSQADFAARLDAFSLRFENALYSEQPLAEEQAREDRTNLDELFIGAMRQNADVRIVFWPNCFEENDQRVFETTLLFEKIGDGEGVSKMEFHFRRFGYKDASALRWSTSAWYRHPQE